MFAHPPHEYLLVPEPIPLDIVYEDEELIIINKPAGLVVHPGHGNYQGTLINGLIYHFQHLPMNSSNHLAWCIESTKIPVAYWLWPKRKRL